MWHTAAAAVSGGSHPHRGRWGVLSRATGHLEPSCCSAGGGQVYRSRLIIEASIHSDGFYVEPPRPGQHCSGWRARVDL